jgi:stage II sporulation protein D
MAIASGFPARRRRKRFANCKEAGNSVDECATLKISRLRRRAGVRLRRQAGVTAMVTTLAATLFAALGLKTAPVSYAAQPLPVIFVAGHGWGHGIGLAQYGAYGYALHGWSYDKIVLHYYPGTTLGTAPLRKVRVLLSASSKRVVISSRSPFVVRDGLGKKHKLPAGSQVLGPGLKLRLGVKKPKALPPPLMFSAGSEPLSFNGRAYRGALRVKKAGKALQVVNVVGLDSYLYGVVTSEMPDRWPAEALAAQAVVARSYALAHLHKGDFDLYPDTRSQVYGGIAAESPSATEAVNETASEVVLYKGDLADTYFFSSSGGKTANVQDVWPSSKPEPYLISVPDPYDTLSPYHNWGPLRFGAATLGRRLHTPGRIVDFHADVASSGRVRTLTLIGTKGQKTISGGVVRAVLGLRSTWFRLGLLSLSKPKAAVVYGSSATLSGIARGVTRVTLEAQAYGGSWKRTSKLVPKSGAVAPVVKPKVSTDYRLESGGFRSVSVHLAVAPFVRLTPGSDGVSVSGIARPVLPGATVQVQRLGTSGWATVAQTKIGSDGSYQATVQLSPGNYRARVVAGRGFAIGLSKTVTVVAQ